MISFLTVLVFSAVNPPPIEAFFNGVWLSLTKISFCNPFKKPSKLQSSSFALKWIIDSLIASGILSKSRGTTKPEYVALSTPRTSSLQWCVSIWSCIDFKHVTIFLLKTGFAHKCAHHSVLLEYYLPSFLTLRFNDTCFLFLTFEE